MSKTLIIIQARTGSTRLSNKVFKLVNGRPLLWYLIKRVQAVRSAHELVVATTDQPGDGLIASFCQENSLQCYRGSQDDVLDRFYQAACRFSAQRIARITGDCPLIDPLIIEKVINAAITSKADYVSNINPPTYPDGMDVEVFTFTALKQAWEQATFKYQREHVTSFITEHPEIFSFFNVEGQSDLSRFRLTVDTPEDFAVVEHIFKALYKDVYIFGLDDIVAYLKNNPGIAAINSKLIRNQNYNINDK